MQAKPTGNHSSDDRAMLSRVLEEDGTGAVEVPLLPTINAGAGG